LEGDTTISPLHVHTPLIESRSLSERWKKRVLLKLENTQPTGSFKIRGIGRLCQAGRRDGATCFVSSSGGNAGYAAAYAARMLRVPITVLVPSTTSPELRQRIQSQGAEVRVVGDVWDETHQAALSLARQSDALYVSPFDHPLIWDGHSTMVDEIAEEMGRPDGIVLSVGGGGLLCGVVQGLHQHEWTDVPVVAVETEGTASLAASLQEGRLVTLKQITGIATTLGAKAVAQQALEWAAQHPIQSVVVTDADAARACVAFANDHRYLVEPASGASLSVAYGAHRVLKEANTVVIIVCGGIGVDLTKLRDWQDRF
jgi:L-serine/L-threonine ammonia-lyase